MKITIALLFLIIGSCCYGQSSFYAPPFPGVVRNEAVMNAWAATALVVPKLPVWTPVNATYIPLAQQIFVNLNYFVSDTTAGSFSGANGTSAHPWGAIRYAMTTGCSYTTGAVEIIVTGASSAVASRAWVDNTHQAVDFVVHPATNAYVNLNDSWMVTMYDAATTTTGWTGSLEMWGFSYAGGSTASTLIGSSGSNYPQVALYIHNNLISTADTTDATYLVKSTNAGENTDFFLANNTISGVDTLYSGGLIKNIVMSGNKGSIGNGVASVTAPVIAPIAFTSLWFENNKFSTITLPATDSFFSFAPSLATTFIGIRNNSLDASGYSSTGAFGLVTNPTTNGANTVPFVIDGNTITTNSTKTIFQIGSIVTNQTQRQINDAIDVYTTHWSSIGIGRNTFINRNSSATILHLFPVGTLPIDVGWNLLKAGTGSSISGTHAAEFSANNVHVHNNVSLGQLAYMVVGDNIELDHNTGYGPSALLFLGIPASTSFTAARRAYIHNNIGIATGTSATVSAEPDVFTDYAYQWSGTEYALPYQMSARSDYNDYFVAPGSTAVLAKLTYLGNPATWVTGTAYAVGVVIAQTYGNYICLIAHTSGTFATDLASGDWALAGSYPAWVSGTAYTVGQLVTNGTTHYACLVANTAGTTFAADLSAGYWETANGLYPNTIAQMQNVWATSTVNGVGTTSYNSFYPLNDANSLNTDPQFPNIASESLLDWIPANRALLLPNGDYVGALAP